MIDEQKLQQRMQRIAELVSNLDSEEVAPGVRGQAKELIESVMDLHGEALDRTLQVLHAAGESGEKLLGSLADDPVVSSVLLLYGLHPLDFETRVRRALEKVRPTLHNYGTHAELMTWKGGAVRIRMHGADSSFTARAVKAAVEEELYAAAPDAVSVVLIGLEKYSSGDFVPLEMVGTATAGKVVG
jgi:Fe-S cluster biogenesis protein NfuA